MSLNSVQSFVIENCNGPTIENGLNNVCLHPLSRTFTFTFSSLLPANIATVDFRNIEPAVILYLPLLQMPLMTVKQSFCYGEVFVKNILKL